MGGEIKHVILFIATKTIFANQEVLLPDGVKGRLP